MKRLLVIALVTFLGLLILTEASYAEQTNRWKIGHVRPMGSPIDTDINRLAQAISRDVKGKITFDVIPEGRLGDYTVVSEMVSMGDVQMFVGPFGTGVDKRLALPFVPYLATNWAEARKLYGPDRPLRNNMTEWLQKQNIRILGGWPVYFGGIVLKKEPPNVKEPVVSKNMIIRTPPMRSFELTARAMGYTPYPITWAYAKMGLKTGMVQGMIGGGAEGYAGLKDLAKYYLPVKDHFECWFVYMNLDLWKSLSTQEKTAVQNAVSDMEQRRWEVAEAEEQASVKRLSDQGTTIITLSERELARMIERVRQFAWPSLKQDIGETFDEVVASVKD